MPIGKMHENNWARIWKESNRHRKKKETKSCKMFLFGEGET